MSLNKSQIKKRVDFAFAVLSFLAGRLRIKEIFPKSGIATKKRRINQNKLKKFLRESNPNLRDTIYNLGQDRGPADVQRVADLIEEDPTVANIGAVFDEPEQEVTSDPETSGTEAGIDVGGGFLLETVQGLTPMSTEESEPPVPSPPVSTSSQTGSPNLYRAIDIARRLTGEGLDPAPVGQNLRTRLFNHLIKYKYTKKEANTLINQNIQRLVSEGVPLDELEEFKPAVPQPPTAPTVPRPPTKKAKKEKKTTAQVEAIIEEQQDQNFTADLSELPAIENATETTPPRQDPIPNVERVQPRQEAVRIPTITRPNITGQEPRRPSGDVQQDIITEAQEGKHTPKPRPLASSQVSGVQGLNIPANQLRRITSTIRDPNLTAAATEILGRNTIDFNLLSDRLGTVGFVSLLGQMIGGPLASALSPIVGGAIPQIRNALGADFNRFFSTQGNQLQLNVGELRLLNDQSLDRIINSANLDQFTNIRNQLVLLTEAGRIGPENLRLFDRISNRRYVLNTGSLDNEEEFFGNSEERRDLNRFLDLEAAAVDQIQNNIDRNNYRTLRANIERYDRAFNTAPLTVTQEYSRAIQRAYEIPYFQAVNITRSENPEVLRDSYNDILQRTIRSSLPIDQQEVIIRSYANSLNDMQEMLIRDYNPIQPPTEQQIEAERERLTTISNRETVQQSIIGGAVLGGFTSAGIAAARGAGLQASLQAGVTGAVSGAGVGAGIGVTGAMSGGASAIPGIVAGVAAGVKEGLSTTPIEPPPDTLKVIQEEQKAKKGTLRPKFIIPSTSILEKSQSEIQADFDEFSMFDFVIPSSEGTEGNNKNNPLKRSDYLTEQLRLNGGGIELDVPLGELDLATKATIDKVMVGPELPEMTFENSVYNLSEFEINPYDPNNDRLQIEALNPYKYYSRVQPYDISRSVLFSKVP